MLKLEYGSPLSESRWKMFKIRDLFHLRVGRPNPKHKRQPGTTRYITGSLFNNGCTDHVGNTDGIHNTSGITVVRAGSTGSTFYQPAPFYPAENLFTLTPKTPITDEIGLFLATIIEILCLEHEQYVYKNKPKIGTLGNNEIPLPVTATGGAGLGFHARLHECCTIRRTICYEGTDTSTD